MKIRKVKESPKQQGVDERIAYVLDTDTWEGYDSGVAVVIKDTDGEDVSSTHLDGSPSVAGDEIKTPLVVDLVNKIKYRLEILWVKDGNTLEAYCIIIGET